MIPVAVAFIIGMLALLVALVLAARAMGGGE